jgi:hypothetical protein
MGDCADLLRLCQDRPCCAGRRLAAVACTVRCRLRTNYCFFGSGGIGFISPGVMGGL